MSAPPAVSATGPPLPLPHLLSLKVLRTAKPSGAITTTSSFPYDGQLGGVAIEKLREESSLSRNGTEFGLTGNLQLPASFGIIYLGETFSALLSISNDSFDSGGALSPSLKVEMHTSGVNNSGGSKHLLLTLNGGEVLNAGESKEGLVQHEIKELGMHALVCTVSYAVRTQPDGDGSAIKTITRTFRKIFKFEVSNPLSVRTKAHSPYACTATSNLSSVERDKVFLEVQVQNQAQHGMYFEKMQFEPTLAFTSVDINHITSTSSTTTLSPPGLFEGSSAVLPINSVRQYLYVLSPAPISISALPGSSEPLGRLNIVWRTPNGETGKLQTSMLGRRVPIPTTPLHQINTNNFVNDSPPVPTKESSSPPPTNSLLVDLTSKPSPRSVYTPDDSNLTFDLTVSKISPSKINLEQTFEIEFSLVIKDRSAISSTAPLKIGSRRRIQLVAQYVKWTSDTSPISPLLSTMIELTLENNDLVLPRPIRIISATDTGLIVSKQTPSSDILKLGSTTITLPELSFNFSSPSNFTTTTGETFSELDTSTLTGSNPPHASRARIEIHEQLFSMKFLAAGTGGLKRVGGIRILLIESSWGDEGVEQRGVEKRAKLVLELATVAEVWVGNER